MAHVIPINATHVFLLDKHLSEVLRPYVAQFDLRYVTVHAAEA